MLVLAASLTALVGNASAQTGTEPALAAATDCAARLRAATAAAPAAVEPPKLAEICSDLALELGSGEWASALAGVSIGDLTARPFQELVDLIAEYARMPDARRLASDDLASIVETLRPFESVAESSLWDRARGWLEERLGFDEAGSGGGLIGWLRTLSIPETWLRTVVYVLGFTIALAALVIVVNELRIAGVLGSGSPGRDRAAVGQLPAWAKRVPLSFDGVRRAPAARQPGLLLALCVERLRARFGDAVPDSLTHRELSAAASGLGLRRQAELDAVASAAERVTFGGWRPAPGDVESVMQHGKAVLEELDAAAAGAE